MNLQESPRVRLSVITDEERRLVRMELEKLTKNVHFSSSKRYPALLRYVVEKALEGRADDLKERTVGVEVFHRPPDYDTNSDTVVRVTAGEVRKRLALTYHESNETDTIRISLPAGSYIPEFYRQVPPGEPVVPSTEESGAVQIRDLPQIERASSLIKPDLPLLEISRLQLSSRLLKRKYTEWQTMVVMVITMFVVVLAGVYHFESRLNSVDQFWRPLRSTGAPVLFCAGALIPTTSISSGFTEADKYDDYPYISMATAGALASVITQLNRNHMEYLVQPSSSSTLTDMRAHPTILVGAYDNKWTVLLLKDLRFRFNAKPLVEISDSKNTSRLWRRTDGLPYKDKDDYAIVARFHDKVTDNLMVVIAGLGKNGTEAAAQFVTTSRYLDLLDGPAAKDWQSRNIEIVLKTAVVDSKTGAPSIEAVEVW